MNFKMIKKDNGDNVLVNFENVCDIHKDKTTVGATGSIIYFNTQHDNEQASVKVEMNIDSLKEMLEAPNYG